MRIRMAGYVPAEGRFSMVRTARSIHAHLLPLLEPGDFAALDDPAAETSAVLTLRGPRVKIQKRLLHPLRLWTASYDVLHLVDNDYAVGVPPNRWPRTVVTVHDLMPFLVHDRLEDAFSGRMGLWFYRRGLANLPRAGMVACDSQFTRQCLLERTAVDPARVEVIHLGVESAFRPGAPDDPALAAFRARHGLADKRVLLHVGACEPYKRVESLLHVTADLRAAYGDRLHLLKVGGRFSESQQDLAGRLGLADALVHLTGLSEPELVLAYNAADVLLWPSKVEGFGLPVLEAMACGTPVVCSNGGSLAEIAGDAAAVYAPDDVDGMRESVRRVLDDPPFAEELRARGLRHAQSFTWDKAARRYYGAYRRVAGNL